MERPKSQQTFNFKLKAKSKVITKKFLQIFRQLKRKEMVKILNRD